MRMLIQEIMIDSESPADLARFWASLMGCRWGSVNADLAVVAAAPIRIAFQRVPEPKQVKNRLHLDVQVADAGEACASAIDLGARRAGREELNETGDGYVVMIDPEGNEFCFVVDNDGGWERLAAESLSQN
ncbi:VOC family protein [Microlunatus parietis]|uniref:Glyoxalase-like domain-containing protein n=1 Tax=Microlunatus parietis TaxID=682979 RepID=A0A7Y9IEE6_9ACTN|nr:VOC family protein [Microlunatus parietis]NYE75008.1 hypothetical protein [Microlunatus parietis]